MGSRVMLDLVHCNVSVTLDRKVVLPFAGLSCSVKSFEALEGMSVITSIESLIASLLLLPSRHLRGSLLGTTESTRP